MRTLLSEIDEFCSRHGMARTAFGRLALGDKAFVWQLADEQKPRRVWPETEAKVRKFMDEYVPPSPNAAEPSEQAAA